MASLPHDTTDLYLAPVVLAIDALLDELGQLSPHDLAVDVAVESDTPDRTPTMRQEALLRAIRHLIDTHGWDLTWDPRGLRLTHHRHTLVLGIPPTFAHYIDATAA